MLSALIISVLVGGTTALFILLSIRRAARGLIRRGRMTKPVPSDAVMVLGAYTDGYEPSRTLADRLKAALQLYRLGYVSVFIVCGGQGEDETVTESSSMKRFLILNGVPGNVILEDRYSGDTWENLKNGQAIMQRFQLQTVVVVTSDYHLTRALAVAKQLGVEATGYAAWSKPSDFRFAIREVFAILQYTVSGKTPLPYFH